jgi:hypothetical protein
MWRKEQIGSLDSTRSAIHSLDEKIALVETKRASLPPIPDLIASIREAFIIQWNDQLEMARQKVGNPNFLANTYIHLRGMQDTLIKVRTRLESPRTDSEGI